MVRANRRGNIGFLKEPQRVNVLLSRARHGMYIIGNARTLVSSNRGSAVWEPILQRLQSNGRVLKGLPTTCQLHPNDEPIVLCQKSDFRARRPNGGCERPCSYRLPCGHACPLMCHPTDPEHHFAQRNCSEPCRRFPPYCNRKHLCKKLCKEDCGPCTALVGPIDLTCGHTEDRVRCHDVRDEAAIDEYSKKCNHTVTHKFEPCGHELETTCANSRREHPQCPGKCDAQMMCLHLCQKE